jgi:hypothetical protein
MQRALQGLGIARLARLSRPLAQFLAQLRHQFGRLFEKDRQQLRIDLVLDARQQALGRIEAARAEPDVPDAMQVASHDWR